MGFWVREMIFKFLPWRFCRWASPSPEFNLYIYLTSAFFFCIARTIIWFCWRNLSSCIKMKIAADCLLLWISWGAWSFEKKCSHWKFNICSKNSLHYIQSVQGPGETVETFFHERMASCFGHQPLTIARGRGGKYPSQRVSGNYTVK